MLPFFDENIPSGETVAFILPQAQITSSAKLYTLRFGKKGKMFRLTDKQLVELKPKWMKDALYLNDKPVKAIN